MVQSTCEKLLFYGVRHREKSGLSLIFRTRGNFFLVGGGESEIDYLKVSVQRNSCLSSLVFFLCLRQWSTMFTCLQVHFSPIRFVHSGNACLREHWSWSIGIMRWCHLVIPSLNLLPSFVVRFLFAVDSEEASIHFLRRSMSLRLFTAEKHFTYFLLSRFIPATAFKIGLKLCLLKQRWNISTEILSAFTISCM